MSEAAACAADARLGAGDMLWSQAEGEAAAAVVLEPEIPLSQALQMVPLMVVAVCDALGALGPPNLALTCRWPATILANGGDVGAVTVAVPPKARLDAVPVYIVVGFRLTLALPDDLRAAPGTAVHMTALHEEGAGDIDRSRLIEAAARHFLTWFDAWQHEGMDAVSAAFVARMPEIDGVRLTGLDAAGRAKLVDGRVLELPAALGLALVSME